MKALLDTDVLLDVALARQGFVEESVGVLRWAERSGEGCIAWHSISNCAYLLKQEGRTFLHGLLKIVEVAEIGHRDAQFGLGLPMSDVDDALQVAAAMAWGAERIVTRNLRDYRSSPILAVSPGEWLQQI